MASLYEGAAPPSDLPALLTDMILRACPKRSRQLEAQQEHEHEVEGPSRRTGSLLGRPQASSSCSCCASSWRLRFGQAPRIMSVNSAGRSLGGAAPPYRLAIRRPSRPRRHHASPRGSITRADAARAAARPVHFQHDSTRSFTISQKLQERSPRNFRSGTVVRKRRKKSNVA